MHKHQWVIDFRRGFRKGPPIVGYWRVRCEVYGCSRDSSLTSTWYEHRYEARKALLRMVQQPDKKIMESKVVVYKRSESAFKQKLSTILTRILALL